MYVPHYHASNFLREHFVKEFIVERLFLRIRFIQTCCQPSHSMPSIDVFGILPHRHNIRLQNIYDSSASVQRRYGMFVVSMFTFV